MQLGTREIRHIILNNQVVNSSRALHSLKHTVPKSHKNIAIHMVDHIRRLGVFPANYALDLGEFIDSNGNSYIDIVELNPISCSIKLFKGHHPHPAGEKADRYLHSPAKHWTGRAPQMRSS